MKFKIVLIKVKILYWRINVCFINIQILILNFLMELTKNTTSFKRWSAKLRVIRVNAKNMFKRWFNSRKLIKFSNSLLSYLALNKAGFEILCWRDPDLKGKYIRYRFFWKGKIIRDMPDVSCVCGDWKMTNDGHVSYMPSDTIRGMKINSFYEDDFLRYLKTNGYVHDI